MKMTKYDCIDYVKERLGFVPVSTVCNMCFANDFDRCYSIFKEDVEGWKKILELDYAMANKPKTHRLNEDVFMFRWQALKNIRLKDIDMEEEYKQRNKYKQLSIFDDEEKMGCMGGCFL